MKIYAIFDQITRVVTVIGCCTEEVLPDVKVGEGMELAFLPDLPMFSGPYKYENGQLVAA